MKVGEGVAVRVGVALGVAVGVGVAVKVGVGLGIGVLVRVGVGVGLRKLSDGARQASMASKLMTRRQKLRRMGIRFVHLGRGYCL